jgi:hypothetical protein
VFTTFNNRGWNYLGSQIAPMGGPEVVQFGTGTVVIIPEPSAIVMLLLGLIGLSKRR